VPQLNPMDEEIQTRLVGKRYTEAFELVMTQYQNKVFRLAYSMLGNRELAEDAAQEIFVRIWRALPGYRGLSSVSTWIYSIARNRCLHRVDKWAQNVVAR
jgi:RNA polymerase sigma-70 factor (ECF subfamily)